MKVVLAVVLLAVIVSAVLCETCNNDQECKDHHMTVCTHHTHVACDKGNCHCLIDASVQTSCVTKSDCDSACPTSAPGNGNPGHCLDNYCRCRDDHVH